MVARSLAEHLCVQVEAGMFKAVHSMVARSLADFPTKPRGKWVLQWPGMCVLVVNAIYWTRGECMPCDAATVMAWHLCVCVCVCAHVGQSCSQDME